jgi:hypothetical protein
LVSLEVSLADEYHITLAACVVVDDPIEWGVAVLAVSVLAWVTRLSAFLAAEVTR